MKGYILLLCIDAYANSIQSRQVCSSVIGDQLSDLKSCEGVLWLNENAWLFDMGSSGQSYDQVRAALKQEGVQLLSLSLSSDFDYTLLGPLNNFDQKFQAFLCRG